MSDSAAPCSGQRGQGDGQGGGPGLAAAGGMVPMRSRSALPTIRGLWSVTVQLNCRAAWSPCALRGAGQRRAAPCCAEPPPPCWRAWQAAWACRRCADRPAAPARACPILGSISARCSSLTGGPRPARAAGHPGAARLPAPCRPCLAAAPAAPAPARRRQHQLCGAAQHPCCAGRAGCTAPHHPKGCAGGCLRRACERDRSGLRRRPAQVGGLGCKDGQRCRALIPPVGQQQ